ncbi:hypothetical protein [Demequina aurantiaca]|uniref:hypothetical protein n=1 Tax=Demequina aurantiaca TaxID=676200 RepID=UPI003D352D57
MPKSTATNVAPLYDIQMEALLDNEAVCECGDNSPAVAVVTITCGCHFLMCAAHQRRTVASLDALRVDDMVVNCVPHHVKGMGPDAFTIRPV